MPYKKKEPDTPAAPARPIRCAFCKKELNPLTDEVTFIGMGKWRDGPGLFHAVCSAKTPDNRENPCFVSGMTLATKNEGHDPICMTFEEWKARPIRRHAFVTRVANGRYELQLIESHLNSYYFMETTHAASADKAHEVLRRWQADWDISPEDLPEIEKMAEKAPRQRTLKTAKKSEANEQRLSQEKVELPREFVAELERHSNTYLEHLLASIRTDGDDCESCRICRGFEKLYLQTNWFPLMQLSLEMDEAIRHSPILPKQFLDRSGETSESIMRTIREGFGLKDDDDKHNVKAMKRSIDDMKAARAMQAKFGLPQ